MINKKKEIGKIRYGEISRFYPFKFESSKSHDEICKLVQKSNIVFSEEYQEKIINSLGGSLVQIVDDLKTNFEQDNQVVIRMPNYKKYKKEQIIPKASNDVEIQIEKGISSVKFYFTESELVELEEQIRRAKNEEELCLKIYGQNFIEAQDRFVLIPYKLKLKNEEIVWSNAELYIFTNGMGILKIQIPIINTEIDDLKQNDWDALMVEGENKWWGKKYKNDIGFKTIKDDYMNGLMQTIKMDICVFQCEINYISFIEFEGMPKQIGSESKAVEEDLFRIIAAPVPDRKCTSYTKEAMEYIKENSWGRHNVKYIVKTTGGCLSYVDQDFIDEVFEQYEDYSKEERSKKPYYKWICGQIAGDIYANVEFALLITILKKMINFSCYFEKTNGLSKIEEIQEGYYRNILFICEMQEGCYGSVSEQTEFFEKRMCHYLKPQLMESKLKAIDNILDGQRKEKEEKIQKYVSVGSFLITLFFGLPAIYETLVIVRKVFACFLCDIPWLTLEIISVVFWGILNIYVFSKLKINKLSDKKEKCFK